MEFIKENFMIVSTVDNHRLHIAHKEYYQGSVNSYNNFFTRFFMLLIGKAMELKVNNKTYCVNKNSYIKFLNIWKVATDTRSVVNFHDLNKTIATGTIVFRKLFHPTEDRKPDTMRDHISPEKSKKRLMKMMPLLLLEPKMNEKKILKLIYKGALLDASFLLINNKLPFNRRCFPLDKDFPSNLLPLAEKSISPSGFAIVTPVVYANIKKDVLDPYMLRIQTALLASGATPSIPGYGGIYERKIVPLPAGGSRCEDHYTQLVKHQWYRAGGPWGSIIPFHLNPDSRVVSN